MKILVLIKQVPEPDAIRFDASGHFSPNTPRIVNEYDQYALEAAIQIQEQRDDVEIAVASIGPASARDAVSRGLAMGADTGVLIKMDGSQPDSLATARILAEVSKADSYDLILVGQETSDSGTGNVGPQLSALLDIPFVSNVVDLNLKDDGTFSVEREVEEGHHIVEVQGPVILCALTGLTEPRSPTLKGIMAARRKTIEEQNVADYDVPGSGVTWSELREEEREIQGIMIETDPESAAKQLVELLRERDLV